MPADSPTILATSGGYTRPERGDLALGPLIHHAVELSGATGRPRLAYFGPASGDQRYFTAWMAEGATRAGYDLDAVNLFPMPSVDDLEGHPLEQDVVWVDGGSVANLLAVWRVHGLDEIFRRVWEAGVVLAGVSAGSICWFRGGTTDSFGPELRAVTNGLALLPTTTGCTTTPRSDAGRPCTGWSPTAPSARRTAPTPGLGWSTAAPSSSRRWPSGAAPGATG